MSPPRTRSAERRSADTEFTSQDEVRLFWQDLTEAGSLKLREVLKYCARGEAGLWRTHFDGDAFWIHSGQIIPFYVMDVSVSAARVHIHEPVQVVHTRRFGREVDAQGRVARLVSAGDTGITGRSDDGTSHEVARLQNYGYFVRRKAPPGRRRVKRLHPSLNLTPVPKRIIEVPGVADFRSAPPGWGGAPMAGRFGLVSDSDAQCWTFTDTDSNHHVHSMAYVVRAEDFVFQALGQRGIPIASYYPRSARLLFRRPGENGGTYWRVGRFYRAPARDAYLFVGAFSPHPAGLVEPGPPSALVQLEIARRPDCPAP